VGCDKILSISARSDSDNRQPVEAALVFTCSGDVAPAITETTAGLKANHDMANSTSVRPREVANFSSDSTKRRFSSVKGFVPNRD
jgi:hypothetical protein